MKKSVNKSKSKLYQIVLYLSPGDYHRYHAPADFLVKRSNHVSGKLAPVYVNYLLQHPGVYETNERVATFGEWLHGFMSLIFVGAKNVGSMTLKFDKELTTNKKINSKN